MERTWLVQRLLKPRVVKGKLGLLAQNLAFGGGLRNGGMSDEAMDLIKDIFRFDYMGSAEFEFGAVPETLSKIFDKRKNYIGFEIKVLFKLKDFSGNKDTVGDESVYIICDKKCIKEVEAVIRKLAVPSYGDTKERVRLDEALAKSKYSENLAGWLELDNGFMFFSDKDMYKKTLNLFGIKEIIKNLRDE